MVFNLDFSVSNDDLRQIFGVYGEIKEVGPFTFALATLESILKYISLKRALIYVADS